MADKDDDGKTEAAAPLTQEAVQAMINGALTQLKKAHAKELTDLRAELSKAKEPPAPPPEDEEKKTAIQVARETQARLKAAEEREKIKDEKLKKQRAESAFKEAWQAKGLDPKHARAQLALLREEGKVKVDDDERVYIGDDPLEAHMESFAKEHGASYKPPRATTAPDKGKAEGAAGTTAANGAAKLTQEQAGSALISLAFGGNPVSS